MKTANTPKGTKPTKDQHFKITKIVNQQNKQ